jgi:hypothetical protein
MRAARVSPIGQDVKDIAVLPLMGLAFHPERDGLFGPGLTITGDVVIADGFRPDEALRNLSVDHAAGSGGEGASGEGSAAGLCRADGATGCRPNGASPAQIGGVRPKASRK